uniref:Uncharacterized protein n=1 Tax=Arundo donax TaxID=35708 RepID=A0A0A8ZAX7_ARUDO
MRQATCRWPPQALRGLSGSSHASPSLLAWRFAVCWLYACIRTKLAGCKPSLPAY